MADVGSAVRAYLLSKTAVTSLIGQRIYTDLVPQNETLPAVSYMLLPTIHEHQLSGFAGVAHTRIQFDVYADKRLDANAVCEAIRTCGIIGFRGTQSEVFICGSDFDGPWYSLDYSNENSDDHRYVTTFEILVNHTESM